MRKVVALPAPKPSSVIARNVAWAYAAVLVVMAVAQLFEFEKFLPAMDNYWLPGNHGTATLLGVIAVFTEIFALPFLLRMTLSSLMRSFSALCGLVAPLIWFFLSIVQLDYFHGTGTALVGYMFGTVLPLPNVYLLVFAFVLEAAALYAVRGLPSKK
jgi:hypothetical protein